MLLWIGSSLVGTRTLEPHKPSMLETTLISQEEYEARRVADADAHQAALSAQAAFLEAGFSDRLAAQAASHVAALATQVGGLWGA